MDPTKECLKFEKGKNSHNC